MATIYEQTDEQKIAWAKWVSERPPIIQAMIKSHPPDKLYRLKTTGKRVTIESYAENGTLTVDVTGEFNSVMFDIQVFGISPDNLEECDLPGPDEKLGTILKKPEEIDAYIELVRERIKQHEQAP